VGDPVNVEYWMLSTAGNPFVEKPLTTGGMEP
jgi:hypothetical protein